MKLGKLLLIALFFVMLGGCQANSILSVMMLRGCQADPTPDPGNVETWELLPFYGELRFLIVRQDTGAPISGAMLQVPHLDLDIVELRDEDSIRSGQDGRMVIHQMRRDIRYWGEGPPRPTFTFSAPGFRTQTLSAEELASGTPYDPYRHDGLPTTTFQDEQRDGPVELPVYEFTIRLVPSD